MKTTQKFALIGAAGFVAPRHMKAIKETGNELIAIMDKNDSVGIIDSYFPNAHYFSEFERFDRFISKQVFVEKQELDYVSICTPNYLHDSHIRFALRNNAHAICEKPLVLNPWNVSALQQQESLSGRNVYAILQLRLHPSSVALKKFLESHSDDQYDIDLAYITSRGNWYLNSWKGDLEKSGGLSSNIGVHFFDLLSWIFGPPTKNVMHTKTPETESGYLEFKNARVRWFLSINEKYLPKNTEHYMNSYRSIQINGEEWEFSDGFQNLHTLSYEHILEGKGFGLSDAESAIQIIHDIRNQEPIKVSSDNLHPFNFIQ